jgi:F-type H+-transporting ATPase subunit delta
MLRYTNRFAQALLEYANDKGIEAVYVQAQGWAAHEQAARQGAAQKKAGDGASAGVGAGAGVGVDAPLGPFLAEVPPGQREAVVKRFLSIARGKLNVVDAEVTAALPLTPGQRQMIEIRLIRLFKKRINLTTAVDPSLLGGIRIVAGSVVMDDTIKRKLSDMKESLSNTYLMERRN